jgi:hypothetical protein
VASAAAITSALGSPANPVVGAPAVAASTAMITVRDDLTVGASAAAVGRSTSRCPGTVGVGRYLPSSTVATDVRTATCGFIVLLAVPDRGALE